MSVVYSSNTQLFLKELTKIQKTPKDSKPDNRLKSLSAKAWKTKSNRMYTGNTDKFEAIDVNRDHLIATLMPMVVKIAKSISVKFGSKIEYDDCISAGMQGAIIATDIYIDRSRTNVQPAKLSTYAHSYIVKYVNEHCYNTNSLLSHGPTKWKVAANTYVMSGNQSYKDEGRASEFFDIANDQNLMVQPAENNESEKQASQISNMLFSKLEPFDKSVLFLSFGIGTSAGEVLKPTEIAKRLVTSVALVNRSLQKSILLIRDSVENSSVSKVMLILKSVDLTKLSEWNI